VFSRFHPETGKDIRSILLILVCQAKPGQSCELKCVHLANCPFGK
jgi:hypothetical protein